MTKKQHIELVTHIKETLTNIGWEEDRWGNFKSTINKSLYRVKFQKTSIRFEVRVAGGWLNKVSDYFKNIERLDNGFKIRNLKFEVG